MEAAARYAIAAHNYAVDAENKIHRDDVAARYGFKGGLVPGVADYAYLARAVFEAWGDAWLGGGAMEVKLLKPVYHGETVQALARGAASGPELTLELLNPEGVPCAVGSAERTGAGAPPAPGDFPRRDPPAPEARRDPSLAGLPGGLVLGSHEYVYRPAEAEEAARSMFVEPMPRAADGSVRWHPALCVHDANVILRRNVHLGPWVHTASRVDYLDAPREGETVSVRGRVRATYERRGHVMTDVDLASFAVGPAPAGEPRALVRLRHSAIVRLRPPAG